MLFLETEYRKQIEALARQFVEMKDLASQTFIEGLIKTDRDQVDRLIALRRGFSLSPTKERVKGLMDFGFFSALTGEDRVICFIIQRELSDAADILNFQRRCMLYDLSQPLFNERPKLLESAREMELIDMRAVNQVDECELVNIKGVYGRIDRYVSAGLVHYLKGKYPALPLFVRLDPFYCSTRPIAILNEEVIRAVNPNIMKELVIHKGRRDGGRYELFNDTSNMDAYLEYAIKRVRRLEVHLMRRHSGLLSMMIEELKQESDDIVVGKCIHLDTYAAVGTPIGDAVLQHLDLAINVYYRGADTERLARDLAQEGKVNDASVRTHLLRTEQLPFIELINIATLFFDSTTLAGEWLEDQFRDISTD